MPEGSLAQVLRASWKAVDLRRIQSFPRLCGNDRERALRLEARCPRSGACAETPVHSSFNEGRTPASLVPVGIFRESLVARPSRLQCLGAVHPLEAEARSAFPYEPTDDKRR